MKSNKLLEAIGLISEEYVDEAHGTGKKRINVWALIGKLSTATICLFLVITVGSGIVGGMKGGASMDKYYYESESNGYADYDSSYYDGSYTVNKSADAPRSGESKSNTATDGTYDIKKIIVTANVNLETLDLDTLVGNLLADVNKYGGYIQSASTRGSAGKSGRTYDATIRIPADRYSEFISGVKESGNITYFNEGSEDITSAYYDLQARIDSLIAEEERVMEFYKQAKDLNELMAVEQRLTEIRYEIDAKQTQMKNYDLLTSYSTVNIHVTETVQYTETSVSFFTRLGNAFKNGWHNFTEGIGDFIIGVVYNLWGILILVAVAVLVIRFIKKRRNK